VPTHLTVVAEELVADHHYVVNVTTRVEDAVPGGERACRAPDLV
jgi:hypothetical protein